MRRAPMLLLLLTLVAGAAWLAWRDEGAKAPPTAGTPDASAAPPTATAERGLPAAAERAPAPASEDSQTAAVDGTAAELPTIAARGVVVDARSRQPLADAEVSSPARPGSVVRTDEDGRFELPMPADETGGELLATHDGYLAVRVRVAAAEICAGASEVRMELVPVDRAGTIRGVTVDADDRPLAGCAVRLDATRAWPGPALGVLAQLPSVTTDERGRFVLSPVPPGRHSLEIEAAQHDDHRRNAIDVADGQDVDLGIIVLPRYGWARVHGRVTDVEGSPVAGVFVHAVNRESSRPIQRVRTDRDGRFELTHVAPGTVGLFFERRDAWAAWRDVSVGPHEDSRQDVRLPTGPHFVGGVVTVAGDPAIAYTADCEVPASALVDCDLKGFNRSARIGPDGRFRLDGLAGGPVELVFTRADPWVSLPADPVEVDRLDHRFAFDSVTSTTLVHGTVRDHGGVPLIGAVVAPMAAHPAAARGVSDANGRYMLRLGTTAHSSMALRATCAGYAPGIVHLPATRGDGEATLDFVLHDSDRLAQLVVRVESGGLAVANARVTARTDDGKDRHSGTTDTLGEIRFELGAGKWRVSVRHIDFRNSMTPLELAAREACAATIELDPVSRHARTIEVRTEPDTPLPGARIGALQNGMWLHGGTTDGLGRVTFDRLPGGPIEFSVEADGHARQELRTRIEGADDTPILFRVRPGLLSISGRVLEADGTVSPHTEVQCACVDDDSSGIREWATTDAEGSFRIEHLHAGTYAVVAYARSGLARADAAAGSPPLVLRPQ